MFRFNRRHIKTYWMKKVTPYVQVGYHHEPFGTLPFVVEQFWTVFEFQNYQFDTKWKSQWPRWESCWVGFGDISFWHWDGFCLPLRYKNVELIYIRGPGRYHSVLIVQSKNKYIHVTWHISIHRYNVTNIIYVISW